MNAPRILMAGAVSGILWWMLSKALGARAYGVLGNHELTGLLAGMGTGCVIAALSAPIYRRLSVRSLAWYSPLSVYVAVAIYGTLACLVRGALNDFHPDQNRWEVALQSVLGMWWGISFLLHIAIVVQLFAYANHRCLRHICGGGT